MAAVSRLFKPLRNRRFWMALWAAAVLGVVVVCLPLFFRNLGSQPVVPVHDPYLKDAIHGGH